MTDRRAIVSAFPFGSAQPQPERRQLEHELNGALEAARTLQARLEMIGTRADDVRSVRRLRDDLADELGHLFHPILEERDNNLDTGEQLYDAIVGVPQIDESNVLVTDPPYAPDDDEGVR